MTTPIKDFGSPVAKSRKPVKFKLYGEEFTAAPAIQGVLLMDVIRLGSSDDPSESTEMIKDFFTKILVEESLERFTALTESKDRIVPMETLGEIVGWLVETYSNRPEEQRGD